MRPIIQPLLAFFRPGSLPTLSVPDGVDPSLLVAYEQSLTILLRIGGGLGLVAVVAVSPLLLAQGRAPQLVLVAGAMLVLLLCGIFRQLAYWLRCGAYLVCFYSLAIADLIFLGPSAEAYIYLIGFALFATIYFSYRLRLGMSALALSVATLAGFGALFGSGALRPLLSLQEGAQAQLLLIRGLLFLLVVGTGQAGILALLNALKGAWRRELAARELLEARVAERTSELASAHERALALSRAEAQQSEYLAALHQTTLELLSERDVGALLQAIVERACSFLESAYALILLEQAGELVVMARTEGVLAPIGERALRERAVLTWQCYDTQRPVMVDNYHSAAIRNRQLDAIQLHSVINLPIMAGSRCLGVLSWNRIDPDHSYTPAEIERGLAFARLVAMVIENARLHAAEQRELAERERAEQTLLRQTEALEAAHAQALAQNEREARQSAYLAMLHQTTLDLLGQHDVDCLLQEIVERAAAITQSPYAVLMLEEHGELIVRTFTASMPLTEGMLAPRDVARRSWRAFETHQPVISDNYLELETRVRLYDPLRLRATVSLPILAGPRCLGVLMLSRSQPDRSFAAIEVEQALTFTRLIAVVIDNARLHDTAQRELAERERAEGELKRYADALERQNSELDAFAHTVAHDLKSPLTSIIGYAELLINNADLFSDDEVDRFLGTIMQMGYKMTRIVNDLLMLASVRAESEVPIERLDMDLIIVDLDIRLGQSIASSQATIRRPERWPAAMGYAPWVEEVLANYLSNAIKYGGEPPCVELGAELVEGGMVRFWVHDNGPGLSPEEQAQLFTPFTRLRRRRAEGHGLGLSIAQRIVQRLGGAVGVESQPGQGCRFFFTLPAAPIESGDSSPYPPASLSHWERGEL